MKRYLRQYNISNLDDSFSNANQRRINLDLLPVDDISPMYWFVLLLWHIKKIPLFNVKSYFSYISNIWLVNLFLDTHSK